jgi:energy-converting hydrogenase A subunit R
MINSDWEGPWVTADHAFDIMRRGIDGGARLFETISAYDDYLAYIVKKKGYEPGNTLSLIAPLLIAFDLDDKFLTTVAKDNANFINGSIEAISLLRRYYTVNIISTSYNQYVNYSSSLAGIPVENIYCTEFPIDEYAHEISDEDKHLVREIADIITTIPQFDIDMDTRVNELSEEAVESIQTIDHFFWEILPATGFAKVLNEVKPIGGTRKYEAVIQALEKEGVGLNRSATIGDSITDWKMLKGTKDAGGLALSFNGNEYAISNCNVAVMSDNCLITALLVDLFEKCGLDTVRELTLNWNWSSIEKLHGKGLIKNPIYTEFKHAYTGKDGIDIPPVVWVMPQNLKKTIELSKQYRKSVRGARIGSLG